MTAAPGVMGCLVFHTSTHVRGFWSINGTVDAACWHLWGHGWVIVFQERSTCRNGNYFFLFLRYVHVVDWSDGNSWLLPRWRSITIGSAKPPFLLNLELAWATMYSSSSSAVNQNYFLLATTPFSRSTLRYGVWCPYLFKCPADDKLLIKTDVWSLQVFLDWTHTTIVGIVHVTHFISGTVTSNRQVLRQTNDVCETTQKAGCASPWTVTIGKNQRISFNCCSYRADVDDLLCAETPLFLYRHPFANVSVPSVKVQDALGWRNSPTARIRRFPRWSISSTRPIPSARFKK